MRIQILTLRVQRVMTCYNNNNNLKGKRPHFRLSCVWVAEKMFSQAPQYYSYYPVKKSAWHPQNNPIMQLDTTLTQPHLAKKTRESGELTSLTCPIVSSLG